ncbi:MAG: hypothetical protein ACFWTJ_14810 [Lachnoclostridium sp.]
MEISSLIPARTDASSSKTKSILPDSAWKAAADVSSFDVKFPFRVFGELTNNLAPYFAIKEKSLKDVKTADPPPQVPSTAVICGITPDAIVCFK